MITFPIESSFTEAPISATDFGLNNASRLSFIGINIYSVKIASRTPPLLEERGPGGEVFFIVASRTPPLLQERGPGGEVMMLI
jgi:hypothetical protein